ncbi:DUF3536 domain-containing protein [Chloroflexota bacterium]
MAPQYEARAREFLKDPWAARGDYIEVILNRSPENVEAFLKRHGSHELSEAEKVTVLKLLELQRHAMLMYTSCGWFFDELSGIETVQVIQYAGRAVQLAQELFDNDIEHNFLERLGLARSNIPKHGDGHRIYDSFVKPAMVDLPKVAAHFAVSSLFEEYGEQAEIYCYHIDLEDYQPFVAGKPKLALGRTRVTSGITRESDVLSFGVLHFGDHNVNAGVRAYQSQEIYQTMLQELSQTFSSADFPEVIRLLDKHFGTSTYSIKDLFRDEQRKVLDSILQSALSEIEAVYYQVYEHHYPPMRFLSELGNPIPKSFHSAAEFIMNSELRKVVSSDTLDLERLRSFLDETQTWQVELDTDGLSYLLQQTLERMMARLVTNAEDSDFLKQVHATAEMLPTLPFPVDLWKVQNLYHKLLKSSYPEFQNREQQGDKDATEWIRLFVSLGQQLSIRVD